ncbi:thermonuclease family protein [Variovorax sp. PDC80]|uniref:thermonuclease family protein n=1 Tax=Variovorax sp. PDC80 TaxID=1882827 RepID=UPI0035279901
MSRDRISQRLPFTVQLPWLNVDARRRSGLSSRRRSEPVELDCRKVDRYGRSVCRVHVAPASAPRGPATLDAGLAMITLGLAWWYRDYAREQTAQERGQYEFAEQEARAKGVGLWSDKQAVAPWEWRQLQHSAKDRLDP